MIKSLSKEFILSVLVLPIVVLLVFALVTRLFSTTPATFTLSKDYILLSHYSLMEDAKDEFLGKCELTDSGDILDQVYSVKGLPSDSYILRKHGNMMPGGLSDELYMKNTAMEPIMRYSVLEIVIYPISSVRFENKIVVNDKETINRLLTVRRKSNGTKCEEPGSMNTQIKFNLKSEIIYSCNITADNRYIMLECFDVANNDWYCYDVTSCLKDIITSTITQGNNTR